MPGEYVAWLSSASIDAKDRVTDDQQNTNQYVLVANQIVSDIDDPIADGFPDLIDGAIDGRIVVDESGLASTGTPWTGTDGFGVRHAATCNSWTGFGGIGRIGITNFTTDETWTSLQSDQCVNSHRLYCFQR